LEISLLTNDRIKSDQDTQQTPDRYKLRIQLHLGYVESEGDLVRIKGFLIDATHFKQLHSSASQNSLALAGMKRTFPSG